MLFLEYMGQYGCFNEKIAFYSLLILKSYNQFDSLFIH